MDTANSTELAENSLDPLVTNSPAATAVGLPEAEAVAGLNLEGPCLAKAQGLITQASPSPSTVEGRNEVAATGAQPQQLCHIETIPVELFQVTMWEIMKEYLPLSSPEYYHALTEIRLVCRRWTAILEGMPILWAKLSLDMDEKLIDLALTRSMHCPLTITGALFSSPAFDKLLQHIYRWKHLEVHVEDECIMDCLAVHSAPLLEELSLDNSVRVPTTNTTLFNSSAPMLRIVRIKGGGVRWSTSIPSNLHELVLSDVLEGAPDVDTLFRILSNSPKLTRLQVRNTYLTHSPSSQTRISLPCLRSLELEYLGQGILERLLDAIDIPTSTTCLFSVHPTGSISHYEAIEPINRRLKALTELSRGTKSTLTFRSVPNGWEPRIARTTYEGETDQHGTLTAEVKTWLKSPNDVFEYIVRQLGQGEPNFVPPALHIVNYSNESYARNELELLRRLHKHLPDTDEILIEDTGYGFIKDVFDMLFPLDRSLRLFHRLSTLIIRDLTHDHWAGYGLEGWQKGRDEQGGVHPLVLQTLKIEGGTISAEMVKKLEKLMPNLVLDCVEVK